MGRTALLAALAASPAQASWWNLLTEDFGPAASNRWSYAGVSNTLGQALFRIDSGAGVVQAEWDQANSISPGNPYTMQTSRLLSPLARTLTDQDTFRLRARLVISPGTLVESAEYHQIANIGLYNPVEMGADRTMADNFDPDATQKIKDGSDFVEFSYFAGNDPEGDYAFYRSAEMTIGAHTAEFGDYHFNYAGYGDPWWHSTAMNGDRLPEGTSLYVEFVYHGAATNDMARRGYMALYEDEARTQLLSVNGQPMYYWTWPVPTNRTFTVTHAGFYNYVNLAYFGSPIQAAGQLDDVQVDQDLADATVAAGSLPPAGGLALQWASAPGATYAVMGTADLVSGPWTTQAVVIANGDFTSFTNVMSDGARVLRVERIDGP